MHSYSHSYSYFTSLPITKKNTQIADTGKDDDDKDGDEKEENDLDLDGEEHPPTICYVLMSLSQQRYESG